MACVEVVITAPEPDQLAALTPALVDERLVAGGHHTVAVRSIYRWHGVVEDWAEARVTLHTRAALVPEVIACVVAAHPYEVPCVIAVPITAGNPAYLEWGSPPRPARPPWPPAP